MTTQPDPSLLTNNRTPTIWHRPTIRCHHCGRFIGDRNLGGYSVDKISKRIDGAVCLPCTERARDNA